MARAATTTSGRTGSSCSPHRRLRQQVARSEGVVPVRTARCGTEWKDGQQSYLWRYGSWLLAGRSADTVKAPAVVGMTGGTGSRCHPADALDGPGTVCRLCYVATYGFGTTLTNLGCLVAAVS
jgi:hypothetical protein